MNAVGAVFLCLVFMGAVIVTVLAFFTGCFNGLSIIALVLWGLVIRILWVHRKEQA